MFPPAWLAILPGNLLVDGLVLFLSPTALKCADRKARIRRLILLFWICGFLADFAGTAWMYPGIFVSGLSGSRNLYRRLCLDSKRHRYFRGVYLFPGSFFLKDAPLCQSGSGTTFP